MIEKTKSFIRIKGCPRCSGDILVDKLLEDEEVCLQCGYRDYHPETQTPRIVKKDYAR